MTRLQEGDRVEIKVTGTVKEFINDEFGTSVYLKEGFGFDMSSPEIKVRKVFHPKAEQGEVITGRQIQNTWWKRGTIFRLVSVNGHAPKHQMAGLLLREDGLLHALDNKTSGIDVFKFSDLNPDAMFELRFVA